MPAEAADLRVVPPVLESRVTEDVRIESVAVLALDPGTTEVLRTRKPARTVVVGDPAIVEASATNETTILLTAKAAGFTNLILLDNDGNEFYRRTVRVGTPARPIIVHRGETTQPYLCDPACNLPPEPTRRSVINETVVGEAAGSPRSMGGEPTGSQRSLPGPGARAGSNGPAGRP
jgi:hypothetical protein